jgi:hypothetical protein
VNGFQHLTKRPSVRALAELLEYTARVAVVTVVALYLVDGIAPNAVVPFLSLGLVLGITVFLALASALLPAEHSDRPPGTSATRRVLGAAALALVAGVIVWSRLRDLGSVAYALTGLSVAITVLLAVYLQFEFQRNREY